jgi:hypothetical protein
MEDCTIGKMDPNGKWGSGIHLRGGEHLRAGARRLAGCSFFFVFNSLFSCLRRHADALYRGYTTNVVTSLRLRSRTEQVIKIQTKIKNQTPCDLHSVPPSDSMVLIQSNDSPRRDSVGPVIQSRLKGRVP